MLKAETFWVVELLSIKFQTAYQLPTNSYKNQAILVCEGDMIAEPNSFLFPAMADSHIFWIQ